MKYSSEKEKYDTITLKAEVNPHHINLINSIFESYEGVGILRSIDPIKGLVEVWTSSHFRDEVYNIISDISKWTTFIVYDEHQGYNSD